MFENQAIEGLGAIRRQVDAEFAIDVTNMRTAIDQVTAV